MRLIFVWLFVFGCAPDKPEIKNRDHDDSAVVVEVEKEMITLREYERRIQNYPKISSQNFQTVDQKRANLEYVAQFEALAQYGIKQGYGTDPRALLSAQQQIVEKVERGRFEPSDGEVEKETNARLSEATQPERRRVSRFTSDETSLCDQLEASLQNATNTAQKFDLFQSFANAHGAPQSNLGMKTKAELNKIGLSKAADAEAGAFNRNTPCDVWLVSGVEPQKVPDRSEIETEVIQTLQQQLRDTHRRSTTSP